MLFHKNDPGDAFYTVLEGKLQLIDYKVNPLTYLKEETIISVLGPDRCLGERALLTV